MPHEPTQFPLPPRDRVAALLRRHRRLIAGVVLVLVSLPFSAHAQVLFLANTSTSKLTASPVFVSIWVNREIQPSSKAVFSFSLNPNGHAKQARPTFVEAVYLLWPDKIVEPDQSDQSLSTADPTLIQYVEKREYKVLRAGNVWLRQRRLLRVPSEQDRGRQDRVPYVTVAPKLATETTSAATLIRIPLTDALTEPLVLNQIEFRMEHFVRRKTATWFEEALQGRRYSATFRFFELRTRAVFPLWFEHRDRAIPLGEDSTSQIIVNFSDADDLRIDSIFPPSARPVRSEAVSKIDVLSVPLNASTTQLIDIQFTYFSLPKAIGTAAGFFVLSHLASSIFASAFRAPIRFVRWRFRRAARSRKAVTPRDSPSSQ